MFYRKKYQITKSLNEIKGLKSTTPQFGSGLEINLLKALDKPLESLNTEDLRILIGQNIFLEITIPLAIDKLRENILIEADFYKGDLLMSVLKSDRQYWIENENERKTIIELFDENRNILINDDDVSERVREELVGGYEKLISL